MTEDQQFFFSEGFAFGKKYVTYTEDELIPIPVGYKKFWVRGFECAQEIVKEADTCRDSTPSRSTDDTTSR